jgi:hypothetical protein
MAQPQLVVKIIANTAELLANLAAGQGAIEAYGPTIAKMKDTWALHSATIIQQAALITAAVEQVGASTLTASDAAKNVKVLDAAMAQMAQTGQAIPPLMQSTADALRQVADGATNAGKTWTDFVHSFNIEDAISNPMGTATEAVKAFATSFGIVGTLAVGIGTVFAAVGAAAYELTMKAADAGESFLNLSYKTGMSVVAASQWSGAMQIAGGNADQLSNAVFMLEKRFDDTGPAGDKARNAVTSLGISVEDFAALSPDQKVLALSAGFQALSPEISKAGIVFDLFGRQGREILPELMKPLGDLVDQSRALGTTWTEDDAKAAEALEMSLRALQLQFDTFLIAIGRDLIPALTGMLTILTDVKQAWNDLPAPIQNLIGGPLAGAANAAHDIGVGFSYAQAAMSVFRGTAGDLPPGLLAIGDGADAAAVKMKALNDQVKDAAYLAANLAGPMLAASVKGVGDAVSMSAAEEAAAIKSLTDVYVPLHAAAEQAAKDTAAYGKAWQTTEDDIQKVWGEAFVAEQQIDKNSLESKLNVLDQERQNAENAAAIKISEGTRSEDQLGALTFALEAKYAALSYTATMDAVRKIEDDKSAYSIAALEKVGVRAEDISKQQLAAMQRSANDTAKSIDQTTVLWDEYYALQEQLSGTEADHKIADIQKWADKSVLALKEDDANWMDHYNAIAAVAQAKIAVVVASYDPLAIAFKGLNADMRVAWAGTWDSALNGTMSFSTAFTTTIQQAIGDPFKKLLAGMLADWEQQLLGPMLASVKSTMSGVMGSMSGMLGGSTTTGGGGSGGTYNPDTGTFNDASGNVVNQGDSKDMGAFSWGTGSSALAGAGAMAGAGLLASSTSNPQTRGGQLLNGAATGAEYGAIAGPVGMAAGAVIGLVVALMQVDPAIKAAEADFAGFQKTTDTAFASTLTATQKLKDGSDTLALTIDEIGNAYAADGKTGVQAQADIKAALDATHVSAQAEDAALAKINATLVESAARTATISTEVTAVTTAAGQLGVKFPDALKASIVELEKMPGLTDAEKTALDKLTTNAAPNYASLTQMASTYGITLAGLGPTFEQANIDSTAKQIFNDFTSLKDAGADVGGVMLGMSTKISGLVDDSINFGVAIPENMRPLLQNLIDAGKLLDANGKAITDMTGITFEATPLDQGLTALEASLNALTTTLGGSVPDAFAAMATKASAAIATIPTTIDVSVNGSWNIPAPPVDLAPPQAAGGDYLVTRPTLFLAGEVPGSSERVSFSGATKASMNSGSGGMSTAAMESQLASIQQLLANQPRAMKLALKEALVMAA